MISSREVERERVRRERVRRERGSALLIVFVFAAVIAIMLYREMPVSAFEAQRQKEQLLIDRGLEYKRAVKLYYLKFGTYPGSIEQLESTNRMRFLRHRFKDPFTEKDDWRLLHMGPGGMLLDSKVNPLKTGQNGSFAGNTGLGGVGSGGGFGSGSSDTQTGQQQTGQQQAPVSLGQPMAYMTPGQPIVYHNYPGGVQGGPATGLPQRAPAIPANSGQANSAEMDANGNALIPVPGVNPTAQDGTGNGPAGVPMNGQLNADGQPFVDPENPNAPALSQAQLQAQAQARAQSQRNFQAGATWQAIAPPNGENLLGPSTNGQAGFNGQQGGVGNPAGNGRQVSPAMAAVQNLLAQGNQSSNSGRLNSGGLAGVASKIESRGIKLIDDQSDYSKWEFYYDPRKDVVAVMGPQTAPGVPAAGGVQTVNNPNYWSPGATPPNQNAAQNGQNAGQTTGQGFGFNNGVNNGTGSNGNASGAVLGPPIPGQNAIPLPQNTPQQQ